MQRFIHDVRGWPQLAWQREQLAEPLAAVRHRQGMLLGYMEALGFITRQEATLQTLTADVLKTSEIEGEKLNLEQVRSSIARHLGIDIGALKPADRHVDGVVEMTLDATQNYGQPLSRKRLFRWHTDLFPTGHSGLHKISTGAWRKDRNGPMQVISGAIGREKVHFQALDAARIPVEINSFLTWFNGPATMDPVLKAALAHFWFVTIHPFDDGNGRIARAIADMALSRADESTQRFYSMSSQIRQERSDYYDILERSQRGKLDITPWMCWFLGCLGRAIESAQGSLKGILAKSRFWEDTQDLPFNDRQRAILNRLWDGFEGKLTSSKYAKLTKCSPDTALRDLTILVDRGVLSRSAEGGRSTSYTLVQKARWAR